MPRLSGGRPSVPLLSRGRRLLRVPDRQERPVARHQGRRGPRSQQYACAAKPTTAAAPGTNEIMCFRLDGSLDVLVLMQNMMDPTIRGAGDVSLNLPMGNLDVTGGYFIWVSHMGGNRADAFM